MDTEILLMVEPFSALDAKKDVYKRQQYTQKMYIDCHGRCEE